MAEALYRDRLYRHRHAKVFAGIDFLPAPTEVNPLQTGVRSYASLGQVFTTGVSVFCVGDRELSKRLRDRPQPPIANTSHPVSFQG